MLDLAIIGAGPAGLSAGIYAASEGLSTAVFESSSFAGGQIVHSQSVRNFLGWSRPVTGHALIAHACKQLGTFGGNLWLNTHVDTIALNGSGWLLWPNQERLEAKAIVLACGGGPRELRLEYSTPKDIRYWVAPQQAASVKGKIVHVFGGGNAAGQAIVWLAAHAWQIIHYTRKPIAAEMSSYLVDIIHSFKNYNSAGWPISLDAQGPVYAFLGSEPVCPTIHGIDRPCDASGHIVSAYDGSIAPGLWAVGDVRADSVKRLAVAVGQGAAVVPRVWEHIHHA